VRGTTFRWREADTFVARDAANRELGRRGEEFGTDRLIEVKTTGLEVRCSEAVFSFGPAPRLYMLPGALSGSCHLDPTQYRAFVQAARQPDSG